MHHRSGRNLKCALVFWTSNDLFVHKLFHIHFDPRRPCPCSADVQISVVLPHRVATRRGITNTLFTHVYTCVHWFTHVYILFAHVYTLSAHVYTPFSKDFTMFTHVYIDLHTYMHCLHMYIHCLHMFTHCFQTFSQCLHMFTLVYTRLHWFTHVYTLFSHVYTLSLHVYTVFTRLHIVLKRFNNVYTSLHWFTHVYALSVHVYTLFVNVFTCLHWFTHVYTLFTLVYTLSAHVYAVFAHSFARISLHIMYMRLLNSMQQKSTLFMNHGVFASPKSACVFSGLVLELGLSFNPTRALCFRAATTHSYANG